VVDDVERGQEREQLDRDAALDAWRRKAASAPSGIGASECIRCGEPIDPRRRAAVPGAERCAECQGTWEKYGA